MSHSLREKLRIAEFIERSGGRILDVGCADGTLTKALAHVFPDAEITGIDLSEDFLQEAKKHPTDTPKQPGFEKKYLWELREEGRHYDAISFVSVLHEIASYDQGIGSVRNALTNAYAMLEPGGQIVIRDMILSQKTKDTPAPSEMLAKIRAQPEMAGLVEDFTEEFGSLDSLYNLNHFLLKYFYTDNWERECPENYLPVTTEEYAGIFKDLGARITHGETYSIPYLREKWRREFGFTEDELELLKSTTILVAQKPEK